jgi:PASTA domain
VSDLFGSGSDRFAVLADVGQTEYQRPMRTRFPLAAIAALAAFAGPALAVPTATKIALPADPSYITYPATGASGLAVTGTSNDKGSKIDLRCDGTVALVLKANVIPNSSGVFSTTIAAATMAKLGGQSCVLRAVPAGSKATTNPAFVGPRLLIGDVRLVTVKGGPSNGAVTDYRVRAPQLTGRGVYSSVGSCGVQGAATFSSTFLTSADVFTCAARLANTIGARSAIQVDGANAYASSGAATLFSAPVPSADLPGLTPIALAVSTDPATGNTTIRESEIIVKCAPDATTWPVNPATCTSFAASGVRLDRTITQGRDGRLASVIDTWSSTDGLAHKLDTVYENGSIGGAAFQFPWLTQSWTLYTTGNLVQPAPTTPFGYLVKYASAGDNDPKHAQGAVIVQVAPEAMAFRSNSSLWIKQVRTVPPSGSLQIAFAYIWGSATAEVQASTAAVLPTLTLPCVVPRVLGQTIPQAKDSLRKVGCQIGAISYQVSGKVKKYRVKAQGPKAGLTVPNATKVNVVISSGPRVKAVVKKKTK